MHRENSNLQSSDTDDEDKTSRQSINMRNNMQDDEYAVLKNNASIMKHVSYTSEGSFGQNRAGASNLLMEMLQRCSVVSAPTHHALLGESLPVAASFHPRELFGDNNSTEIFTIESVDDSQQNMGTETDFLRDAIMHAQAQNLSLHDESKPVAVSSTDPETIGQDDIGAAQLFIKAGNTDNPFEESMKSSHTPLSQLFSTAIHESHPAPYSDCKKKKQHDIGDAVETFPTTLYRMLIDLERTVDGTDIAAFLMPHGRSFIVKDIERFELEIMPNYFPRMSKFASFQRQLNLYDFSRTLGHGPDRGAYYHEMFIRNFPELAGQMRRTKIKGCFTIPREKRRNHKKDRSDGADKSNITLN